MELKKSYRIYKWTPNAQRQRAGYGTHFMVETDIESMLEVYEAQEAVPRLWAEQGGELTRLVEMPEEVLELIMAWIENLDEIAGSGMAVMTQDSIEKSEILFAWRAKVLGKEAGYGGRS
jgi:hypothetical protein